MAKLCPEKTAQSVSRTLSSESANQAIGNHNSGSLKKPASLPLDYPYVSYQKGWVGYNFGTDETIDILKKVGSDLCAEFPGRSAMSIQRISDFNGGEVTEGGKTGSHTIGEDVDVYYPSLSDKQDFTGSYVSGGKTTADLDVERLMATLKYFIKTKQVWAFYIDRKIKKKLCEVYSTSNDPLEIEALKASIPAYSPPGKPRKFHIHHQNHVHVRLKCPESETQCVNAPKERYPDNTYCDRDPVLGPL